MTTPNLSSRARLILTSTLVGAVVGFWLLSILFERLPNELMRSKVILDALHGASQPLPTMVVLGNSIAMNGINTQQLGEELRESAPIWNLSSTSQMLVESLLIVETLPEETQSVLLTLFTDDLVQDAAKLPFSKLNAYLEYGYQVSSATRTLLQSIGPPEVQRALDKRKWQVTLDSRWAVRSAIDLSCRDFLRKDLDLERATFNLYYPAPYPRQLSSQALETAIEQNFPRRSALQGHLSDSASALIQAIAQRLQAQNKRLYIVLLPEHPHLRDRRETGFYQQIDAELQLLGERIHAPVFSLLELLDSRLFVDQVHPNTQGAQRLTSAIARALEQAGENR
jgi:hypothetical protein